MAHELTTPTTLEATVRAALPVLEAAAPRVANRRYRQQLNRIYAALGETPPHQGHARDQHDHPRRQRQAQRSWSANYSQDEF